MSQWVDKVYLDLVLWQGMKARGGVSAEDLGTYEHVYKHGYASASSGAWSLCARSLRHPVQLPYAAVAVSQC
jgi:hypothetical protein